MLDDRFRRIWDPKRLPDPADFDPADDLHLDELAGVLLTRFGRDHDAEAFTLLIEATRERLVEVAAQLASRRRLIADPELMVRRLMRRLYRWPLSAMPHGIGFLALARGLMEQDLPRLVAHGSSPACNNHVMPGTTLSTRPSWSPRTTPPSGPVLLRDIRFVSRFTHVRPGISSPRG